MHKIENPYTHTHTVVAPSDSLSHKHTNKMHHTENHVPGESDQGGNTRLPYFVIMVTSGIHEPHPLNYTYKINVNITKTWSYIVTYL